MLAADFTQCPWSRAETDGRRVDSGAAQRGRDVAGRGGQMMLTQLEPESGSEPELSGAWLESQSVILGSPDHSGRACDASLALSDRPEQVIMIRSRAIYQKWENSI